MLDEQFGNRRGQAPGSSGYQPRRDVASLHSKAVTEAHATKSDCDAMSFSRRTRGVSWPFFYMALMVTSSVSAAQSTSQPAWFDKPYRYVVIHQDMEDVMREFGRNLSIPVVLDENVDGQAEGDIRADTAGEFLEQLCSANGLAWFYLDQTLHVSDTGSLDSGVFDVSQLDRSALERQLESWRVGEPLSVVLNGTRLTLAGPSSWIELIGGRLEALMRPSASAPGASSVRVIRGSTSENIERPPSAP